MATFNLDSMVKNRFLSFLLGKYVYHFLFIIVYMGFIIQGKKWYNGHDDWGTFLPIFIVQLLLMLVMIAVNTLFLMPRFLKKKNFAEYFIGIVLLVLFYTAVRGVYDSINIARLYSLPKIPYATYTLNAFLFGLWFAVISSMLHITQVQYESKQELKNIKINQLETELKYLKSQINPHFLFNGLNTIFGFIDKNNQQAKDALLQFSDLLRYNLYEADVDKVDLVKEAGYIQNYIAIQRARSDSSLNVDLHVNIGANNVKVAPLLFLPFIENAFKYVSRDGSAGSAISIFLSCDNNTIMFECENSFDVVTNEGKGIGLENVKRRLDLLYKNTHELLTKSTGRIWRVKLKLMV